MNGIKLGIIVLDRKNRVVCFQNPWIIDILKQHVELDDYDALSDLFLQGIENSTEKPPAVSESKHLRIGSTILGYRAYHTAQSSNSILIIQDITEKSRLESIAEAVEMMNNIGYIFSEIRHELGNPTNSIKMTMEVLRNNIHKYSKETILNYVDRALADLGRVEYLLKSLRSFSLYENLNVKNHHMPSLVEKFLSLVERDSANKGIAIKTRIEPDVLYGLADQRALQQVMLNILSNAVDAVIGRDSPEIVISMRKAGKLVLIIFEDNGCGIPENQKNNLFKPFFTSKSEGTGLGLAIAKKMLAKMSSAIDVRSEENVGTTVTISIPEGTSVDVVCPAGRPTDF